MFYMVTDVRFPASFPVNWIGPGVPNNEAVSQPKQVPTKVIPYKTTK